MTEHKTFARDHCSPCYLQFGERIHWHQTHFQGGNFSYHIYLTTLMLKFENSLPWVILTMVVMVAKGKEEIFWEEFSKLEERETQVLPRLLQEVLYILYHKNPFLCFVRESIILVIWRMCLQVFPDCNFLHSHILSSYLG